jgi:nitroreductase
MNVSEAIKTRRSVRHYRPDAIPDDVLGRVVGLMRLAPSSRNRQPWKFVVVRDKTTREHLAAVCTYRRRSGEVRIQRFVEEAPVVVVACGFEDQANVFYKGDGRLAIAPGAEVAAGTGETITDAQSTLLVDLASAFSHLMLAAMEEGIGTCWVMGVDEERVKAILGIPADARAPMLMTLSYPAPETGRATRKSLDEIICHERFG